MLRHPEREHVTSEEANRRFHIVIENEKTIVLSNGDIISEGFGIYKETFWLDKKERREEEEKRIKEGDPGPFVSSWKLQGLNIKEALQQYQIVTGNMLSSNNPTRTEWSSDAFVAGIVEKVSRSKI